MCISHNWELATFICVFHFLRGCCSRICPGFGFAAWVCKTGICMIPLEVRYFGAGGECWKLCSCPGLQTCHWGAVLLLCYYFGYNYHEVVLNLCLVSTGVSAVTGINTAHCSLTASTFLVAVVFMGELTQGGDLAENLSFIFIFWLGEPPYLSVFCLGLLHDCWCWQKWGGRNVACWGRKLVEPLVSVVTHSYVSLKCLWNHSLNLVSWMKLVNLV